MPILIVDSTIDQPWAMGAAFRKHLHEFGVQIEARRAPQEDLPPDPKMFSHIILTGSKTSCFDEAPWVHKLLAFIRESMNERVPLLGVCFGHQMIARCLGGIEVLGKSATPEIGDAQISLKADHPLMTGLPKHIEVAQRHYEEVIKAPKGMVVTAESVNCSNQAFYLVDKPVFGVQFHPERAETTSLATRTVFRKFLDQRGQNVRRA